MNQDSWSIAMTATLQKRNVAVIIFVFDLVLSRQDFKVFASEIFGSIEILVWTLHTHTTIILRIRLKKSWIAQRQ